MGAGPSGIEVSDVEAKVIINDEAESEDKEGEQGPQGEDSEQEPQEEEGDQGPQMENPTDDDYKVFWANLSPKPKIYWLCFFSLLL